jgi:catalase-peroxidase
MDEDFDYAKEFDLDLDGLKRDIEAAHDDVAGVVARGLRSLRATLHPHGLAQRGTYRVGDGRGGAGSGAQRFAPLNSWPDNVNLDKARRLLWPIKQKYGQKISWADLMIFTGNCALGVDGLYDLRLRRWTRGRLGARRGHQLGTETTWLGDERYSGDRDLADPLGAVQMGLIYVNPEGPNGNPDPLAAA